MSETSTSKSGNESESFQLLKSKTSQEESHKFKTVIWTDIQARVRQSGKRGGKEGNGKKQVLRDVSGVAYPGEVLAIMGGSGAGKTTLLNILTKIEIDGVKHEGVVSVNGDIPDTDTMRRMSAYVQQIDLFCGTLTVREQLLFSARLRMDRSTTAFERTARVDDVVKEMNLYDCQNTLIGVPNVSKGISIGEKKRLAFACEVLTDPSILFCDEPTSGLDSFMAQQVVTALKDLAKKGKTIITVIHQPSSEVFNMFDKVCFMASGKTAYHGPVTDLCDFFDSFDDPTLQVPESFNPADFVIAQLSIEPETMEEDLERVQMITNKFEDSSTGVHLNKFAHGEMSGSHRERTNDDLTNTHKYAASFCTQMCVLFKRSFLTTLRNPLLLKVKLTQVVLTAIFIGLVNFRIPVTGPTVQNIEGILYNCGRDIYVLFLFPSINVITSELPVFLRERKARIYSVDSYYWAKSMAELPQYTILPIIYGTIVYWSTGLYAGLFQFLCFLLICVLQVFVAISVATAGACLFGDEGKAVTFIPMLALPMLVFGGFYINHHDIPMYLEPFAHLSWFHYGFEALSINQWRSQTTIEGCTGQLNNGTNIGYCPAEDGHGVLVKRGMHTTNEWFWLDAVILIALFVGFRILGLFALKLRVRLAK